MKTRRPAAKIQEIARKNGIDVGKTRIVDAPHSHAAAAKAVELVRQGEAELLMKGSLHSDEILSAVIAKETGLLDREVYEAAHTNVGVPEGDVAADAAGHSPVHSDV